MKLIRAMIGRNKQETAGETKVKGDEILCGGFNPHSLCGASVPHDESRVGGEAIFHSSVPPLEPELLHKLQEHPGDAAVRVMRRKEAGV